VLSSPLAMDARQWREEQRSVREEVRVLREGSKGGSLDAAPAEPALASGDRGLLELGEGGYRALPGSAPCPDHQNYEIVVVDDGSDDNTLEVAEAAQARGQRHHRPQSPKSRLSSRAQSRSPTLQGRDRRVR